MVDTPRKQIGFLGTEFNAFLFAPLGVDAAGGDLSVVSALARLDMDPWAEAEKLTRLPGEAAASKLTGWMSRFPELSASLEDRAKTAARLMALLPQRVLGRVPAPLGLHARIPGLPSPYALIIGILIAASVMLVGQMVSSRPAGSPPAAAATTGAPPPAVADQAQ